MMKKHVRIGFLLFILTIVSLCGQAQSRRDSIRAQRLREVSIDAGSPQKVYAGPAAVQQISAQELKQLPTLQLSDALNPIGLPFLVLVTEYVLALEW